MLQVDRRSGEASHLLESILERISDAVICCDDIGNVTFINHAASELLDFSAADVIGQPLDRFIPSSKAILEGLCVEENTQAAEHVVAAFTGNHRFRTVVRARFQRSTQSGEGGFSAILRTHLDAQPKTQDSARLAAIVESSDDAIIGKTLDGVITSWNGGAQRIFGYAADEVIGHHISLLIPAERVGEEFEILERLRTGVRVDHFDTVRRSKDGSSVDVSLTISPIRDTNGQIIGASKIARDIGERKRSAAAREMIERRSALAIEAAQIGIWDWDLVSQEITWSERFAKFFGIETLAGTIEIFEVCLHPDDIAATRQKLLDAVENHGEYRDEYRVIWADKTVHWIEARGEAIYDDHHAARRMTGTVIDVTAARAQQDASEIAQQRLQMAADLANIGFWDWDLQSDKLTCTQRCADLFGIAHPGEDFDLWSVNIHPDDLKTVDYRLHHAIDAGLEYVNEYRVVWPDRSIHWLESRGRGIYNADGQPLRMMGFTVDITQRKLSESQHRARDAELAHLSRVGVMGDMASGLAHELNQPIGAIMNYAGVCMNLAKTTPVPVEKFLVALQEVINETKRAGGIISRLRSFVTKQVPRRAAADINEIVRKSIALLDFELRGEKLSPQLKLEPDIEPVIADEIQIQQVLVNLICNAMQAMNNSALPRRLCVETSTIAGNVAQVSVIDSGRGMSEDQLSHLFEAFFTTKEKGLGMGLNISRSIIESHGGRLSASANDDGGMRFCFTLPPARGADL